MSDCVKQHQGAVVNMSTNCSISRPMHFTPIFARFFDEEKVVSKHPFPARVYARNDKIRHDIFFFVTPSAN